MSTQQNLNTGIWGNLGAWAEENRFGVISLALLIVGCLGGVTMQMGAVKELWSMILVIVPTMMTLSLLLAVAPMRWILNALALSVVVDLLVILLVHI
jgi:hypothetical protein